MSYFCNSQTFCNLFCKKVASQAKSATRQQAPAPKRGTSRSATAHSSPTLITTPQQNCKNRRDNIIKRSEQALPARLQISYCLNYSAIEIITRRFKRAGFSAATPPLPSTMSFSWGTPISMSLSATACARASESFWLYSAEPVALSA